MLYRSIIVPWESFLYLSCLQHKQRVPERPEHSEAFIKRMYDSFYCAHPKGKMHLTDGDLGGAENGRWISWTIEQMAAILDEVKLSYEWGQVEMTKIRL